MTSFRIITSGAQLSSREPGVPVASARFLLASLIPSIWWHRANAKTLTPDQNLYIRSPPPHLPLPAIDLPLNGSHVSPDRQLHVLLVRISAVRIHACPQLWHVEQSEAHLLFIVPAHPQTKTVNRRFSSATRICPFLAVHVWRCRHPRGGGGSGWVLMSTPQQCCI